MWYKYLIVLILLSPMANALFEKQIYNDWVKSGDYLDIDGETYRAIYIKNTNATVVYFPNGVSTVIYLSNNTCASEWLYRACQSKYKIEKNGVSVPPDINDPYVDIFLFLTLDVSDVDLNLKREFNAEELFVGDAVEIKTTIEKVGTEEITNISFIDSYSKDFEITVINGCEKRISSVVWTGDLNQSSKHVCTYKVLPKKEMSFENEAVLNYNVFGITKSKQDVFTYEVKDSPVFYNLDFPNKTIKTGNAVKILLEFDVLNDFSIKELQISYPGFFNVINYSSEFKEVQNNLVIQNRELKKDTTEKYFIELKTGFVGIHQINVSLSYVYSNLITNLENKVYVDYKGDEFYIDLFNRNNKSVIRIANPSNDFFRDIEIKLQDNIFKLARLDSKKFKEFEFSFLEEENQNISIKYRTSYGQILYSKINLSYGSSTYPTEIEEQLEPVQIEEKQEIQQKTKETQISGKTIALVTGSIVLAALVFIIVSFLKSKTGKSGLDREIEEIKKQTKEKL